MKIQILLISFLILCLISCKETVNDNNHKEQNFDYLKVPQGFPPVASPEDNPTTNDKAELGKRLFYDQILSKNRTLSCESCHRRSTAFCSTGDQISIGFNSELTERNVLSLINVSYTTNYTWDGHGSKLEDMIYNDFTFPLFFDNDTNVITDRLNADSLYVSQFKKAFGDKPKPYLAANAMASFLRTIISGNSPFDKYRNGDKSALNAQEIRGMNLFFSDKVNCAKCHTGLHFTDYKYHNTATSTHYFDKGRWFVTNDDKDRGKFRTSTLRNVALTYPYFHDGVYRTLEQVVDNYNKGGNLFINRDTLMRPLNLTFYEKADLVAFLKSLTDSIFMKDARFDKPVYK
jgi:cytochrome c peroxidase